MLDYHCRNLSKEDEETIFNSYLKYGGFPRLLKFNDDKKIEYLTDSYYAIIFREIVCNHYLRNFNLLESLIKFLIVNIGQRLSINSIKKHLKDENISVSTNTISTYLNYITEAFIILKAKRKDLKTNKIVSTNEKYYCVDPGFYQLKSGISKSKNQLLENIIFLELIRREYNVSMGKKNLNH